MPLQEFDRSIVVMVIGAFVGGFFLVVWAIDQVGRNRRRKLAKPARVRRVLMQHFNDTLIGDTPISSAECTFTTEEHGDDVVFFVRGYSIPYVGATVGILLPPGDPHHGDAEVFYPFAPANNGDPPTAAA